MKTRTTTRPKTKRKRIPAPRTSALLVRMKPDALAAMREAASHLDLSMSQLVAQSVTDFLDRRADAMGARA